MSVSRILLWLLRSCLSLALSSYAVAVSSPQPELRLREERPGLPEGRFCRVPSEAAGREGIAVRVFVPPRPRYPEGAPVVIHVPGGVQPGSSRGRPEFVGFGFIEIHFAFPGGGEGDERSGGTYDFRGPNCIRALADVIRFATGRLADNGGKAIGDLVRGMKVLPKNCGIVGWSHGGNACGLAMATFGHEFPDLAWYASMESPYGEGAANVELGGHETGVNPAYDPQTGVLDLSRIAWSADLSPGMFGKPMLVSTRNLKGAFYFDLNADGRFSPGDDFPANCFVGDAGQGIKAWYSLRVLTAADQRGLIGRERHRHIPTLEESREFWRYRDAAPSIPEAVRKCRSLAVIVYANQHDHVQAAPDHPHILEQVEGFRKAKARFVRLNPDRAYVERVLSLGPRPRSLRPGGTKAAELPAAEARFPDNPAGKSYSRSDIGDALEPASLPTGISMQAAVCELADRVQSDNWSANLETVLYPDALSAPVLSLPPRQPVFDAAPPTGEEEPPRPGPWDNDVVVYRVGGDGAVEKLATFERAGVPTVARMKDGRLLAAHQHFPKKDDANFDKVAVRFSSDEGRSWTEPQVIRLDGLPEGMRFPFDPTLVPLPDGRVRLYFTSLKGRRFDEDRAAIFSAISGDGVHYTFEPGVRFGIEGRPVIDCAVVLHQGVFHLYAPDSGAGAPPRSPDEERRRAGDRPPPGAGYHATSKDGLNFSRRPDVRIEGFRWLGNAQSDSRAIVFFGTGGPPGPGQARGGGWVATSTDGQEWALNKSFPAVPGADPGAVRLKDGSWLVVVTGPPRPGTPSARRFSADNGGGQTGRRQSVCNTHYFYCRTERM